MRNLHLPGRVVGDDDVSARCPEVGVQVLHQVLFDVRPRRLPHHVCGELARHCQGRKTFYNEAGQKYQDEFNFT